MIGRVFLAFLVLMVLAVPAGAFQPPAGQDGFVQVTEVPPSEQLPAAPFVISAYAFFLVLMVAYVWSVGRRLNRVEREMAALQRSAPRSGGA